MRRLLPGLVCLIAACQQSSDARIQPDATALEQIKKHEADVPALVQGNSEFAMALYQQLAAKDGNLFFSPYSISSALAMTYAGARGNTAAEMKTTLRFNLDDERLHPAFGNLILQLQGDGKPRPFQLSIANRLWGQKDYGFLPEFLKIGRNFYDGGLEEADFIDNADGERMKINGWVEKQTKDKIKDLIPQGEITNQTRLVLTNAIYFKGTWVHKFDPKRTQSEAFHLLDGKSVETPMMRALHKVNLAVVDKIAMVELPFEGDKLSMIVILPRDDDGLRWLEKQLTVENLKMWLSKFSLEKVSLRLPKLKVTSGSNLKDVLVTMGMRDAFDPVKANFRGIATDQQLYLSAVSHKAFVDINEEGAEAAAATSAGMRVRSGPWPFKADHPFVFLIRDQKSGSILFMGRVVNPGA